MKNTKQSKKTRINRKSPKLRTRPFHRQISLHPITILLLLCIGVLMIASTYKALGASSTTLSMNITAVPLTEPATITKPLDQDRFQSPDIAVEGTCPDNSYVKIYKNQVFSGVALCISGKFKIMISLSQGANILQAKVFNFSDQEGPESASITVYYDAPQPITPTSPAPSPPSQPKPSAPTDLFKIITDYKYKVHKNGQPIELDLALAGGTSPYALAVDWNDGKINPIARTDKSPFRVEHTYAEKPRMYTYVIKVAASDLNGSSDYIQLMAVVDGNTSAGPSVAGPTGPGDKNNLFGRWLVYLWPAYLIIVLMVLSFYLGEREERHTLLRKNNTAFYR